jgi:hypothetical protein
MSTLTEFRRKIRAIIRAAKQEGAPEVVLTVGGDTVRIPLSPDNKPVADPRPNSFDQILSSE